jgi:hypothetical protein
MIRLKAVSYWGVFTFVLVTGKARSGATNVNEACSTPKRRAPSAGRRRGWQEALQLPARG